MLSQNDKRILIKDELTHQRYCGHFIGDCRRELEELLQRDKFTGSGYEEECALFTKHVDEQNVSVEILRNATVMLEMWVLDDISATVFEKVLVTDRDGFDNQYKKLKRWLRKEKKIMKEFDRMLKNLPDFDPNEKYEL